MKWDWHALLRRGVIAAVALAAGVVGSSQGGFLDVVAYVALWTFVAWAAIRQPAVLLIAAPASAVFGLLYGSWDACTGGAFCGTLAYRALAAPGESLRRRFSRRFFDDVIGEGLSRPILIFLLAVPFMLVGVVVASGTGYLIAGDTGGAIGAIAGILLGIIGGARYFERVHARLAPWQLLVLVAVAVIVSLMWESVSGGLAVTMTLYVALAIGLIVWSRPSRRE